MASGTNIRSRFPKTDAGVVCSPEMRLDPTNEPGVNVEVDFNRLKRGEREDFRRSFQAGDQFSTPIRQACNRGGFHAHLAARFRSSFQNEKSGKIKHSSVGSDLEDRDERSAMFLERFPRQQDEALEQLPQAQKRLHGDGCPAPPSVKL